MLVPMPTEASYSQYIPKFLREFQALCKKPFIQSAYKSGVAAITEHAELLSQISKEGNYWKVLDDATEKELTSQSFQCLQEILLDYTIKEVVSTLFGVKKDPITWTHDMKTYAYGNWDM